AADVGLEVDLGTRLEAAERRYRERVRDQGHLEALVIEGGDREGHAVDRDRALLDARAEDVGGSAHPDAVVVSFCDRADAAEGLDMSHHEVATELVAHAQ